MESVELVFWLNIAGILLLLVIMYGLPCVPQLTYKKTGFLCGFMWVIVDANGIIKGPVILVIKALICGVISSFMIVFIGEFTNEWIRRQYFCRLFVIVTIISIITQHVSVEN